MAAIAYYLLERLIIARHGRDSVLAAALGPDWKAVLSMTLYLLAMLLAFKSPQLASGLYVLVAVLWFLPDLRIERAVTKRVQT
jgi:hypothetical protein